MKKSCCITLCMCVLLYLSGAGFARALQPLAFTSDLAVSDRLALSALLEGDIREYSFSYVDLNYDGQDEIVAVDHVCKTTPMKMCGYSVFGLGQDQAYILMQEKAWSIAVSDEVAFGVRKLLVFKTTNNQYSSTPYTWNALKSRYTEAEGDNQT